MPEVVPLPGHFARHGYVTVGRGETYHDRWNDPAFGNRVCAVALYDLASDPDENASLTRLPEYSERLSQLSNRLLEHILKAKRP